MLFSFISFASIISEDINFFFKIFDKCVLPHPRGPNIFTHFPGQFGQLQLIYKQKNYYSKHNNLAHNI